MEQLTDFILDTVINAGIYSMMGSPNFLSAYKQQWEAEFEQKKQQA